MTRSGVVDRTEQRVIALVLLVAQQHDIPTEHLLTASLVDGGMTSMAIVDLLLAAESEFDLIIPEHELTPHNFTDVATLTALMSRLKSPAPACPPSLHSLGQA